MVKYGGALLMYWLTDTGVGVYVARYEKSDYRDYAEKRSIG